MSMITTMVRKIGRGSRSLRFPLGALMRFTTVCLVLTYMGTSQAALDIRILADKEPIETTPIEIYVSARDAEDNPIGGLTANDFQIEEDGAAQTLSHFSLPPSDVGADTRVSVLFAMDVSSSVFTATGALDAMKAAITDFINNRMQAGDFGAVVKFHKRIEFLDPPGFTDDKAQLIAAVQEEEEFKRGTAFYDVIKSAVDRIKNQPNLPPGARAVIVLSDGRDSSSTSTYDALLAPLDGSDIPVFTIAFGKEEIIEEDVLQFIADATHGKYYRTGGVEDFAEVYEAIGALLQNEYLLAYSSAITDCEPHTLKITAQTVHGQMAVEDSFTRCFPENAPTPKSDEDSSSSDTQSSNVANTTSDSSSSSGGGGGFGLGECMLLIAGVLSGMTRRRIRYWF